MTHLVRILVLVAALAVLGGADMAAADSAAQPVVVEPAPEPIQIAISSATGPETFGGGEVVVVGTLDRSSSATLEHLIDGHWTAVVDAPEADTFSFAYNPTVSGALEFRVAADDQTSETVTIPVAPSVKVTARPSKVEVGSTARVEATLGGESSAKVTLQVKVDGSWKSHISADVSGSSFTLTPTHQLNKASKATYRIKAAGSARASSSDEFTITRTPRVTLTTVPETAEKGKKATAKGRVVGEGGRVVRTQAYVSGAWKNVSKVTSDAKGYFAIDLAHDRKKAGKVKYRVRVDSSVGEYHSPSFTLRRRGWESSIRKTKASEVKYTYKKGCSVDPSKLSTIRMTYRDYDGNIKDGVLIVRRTVAKDVEAAFKEAFNKGFQIAQMRNPDVWKANDIKMMAANNTSAYNCRKVTGNSKRVSPHSYGRSIDINPAQNPYRVGGKWYPDATYATKRPTKTPGLLHKNSPMVKALTKRGFAWYAGWDWHHFQK
ncbi:MAG: M15 family metallopeptidase [Tessaracoccus sp.]|uniref:M15 family metallopeptidase n=1 Tax=Tessaracoccus sp. TaxID=1971211 RepID=UPI001EC39AE1|nr:M15 family metallopeptidase [Tessaracoccus sp.]MBK7820519.1 M15 family metallopeptidase [Tessaracoccus sp.]